MKEKLGARFLLAFLLILIVTGCNGVSELYVKADEANWDFFKAEVQPYWESDPKLSAQDKADRLERLKLWRARIDRARSK